MIDDVIFQVLGPEGLRKIIRPEDRVVLKVNVVGPYMGERGEKGRGIITDPRVVRHVAELVRDIIGYDNGASLKVRLGWRTHLELRIAWVPGGSLYPV